MLTQWCIRMRLILAFGIFALAGDMALRAQAVNRIISGCVTDPSTAMRITRIATTNPQPPGPSSPLIQQLPSYDPMPAVEIRRGIKQEFEIAEASRVC
jgi:hypothetical protein